MTEALHIALVSEHASPLAVLGGTDAGGQNVHVAELARHLAALGTVVTVHTRRDDPALPPHAPFAPGVDVHHVDAGPAEPLPKDELLPFMREFAEAILAAWEVQRPDVVHSHFWMSGLASMQAADALSIPWAHTYHALGTVKRAQQGAHDTSPRDRIPIEQHLARCADLIIATSEEERAELRSYGAAPDRVVRVPCGVDLSIFRPTGPAAPLPRGRRRLVVVGRLVERKGIGNVIEALASLPTDVELVVAGGPPHGLLEDDASARWFMQHATELGVADRVQMLGALDRHGVAELMRSADAVCCCPWYEPFGLVAVEAMACGVPVVATRVGGLAETVVDGLTGVHVPPRRPDAIASAVAALLADEPLRARLARNAARRAKRFGWPGVARATLRHLRSLSGRRSDITSVAALARETDR